MNWSRWLSSHDAVLRLLIVLVRVSWLWPAIGLLGQWLAPSYQGVLIPLWMLVSVFLISEILSRRILVGAPSLLVARFWAAGGGLLAILFALTWQYGLTQPTAGGLGWPLGALYQTGGLAGDIPPALLTALIVGGAWLRGILDGQRRLTHADVRGAFVVGCIAYVLILLAAAQTPAGVPGNLYGWLLLFFATTMVALAVASLDLSRVTGRTERPLRLGRYWAASALTVTAFILGLGTAGAALFSPGVVTQLTQAIGFLVQVLWTIVSYVLIAIAYLFALLLTPVVNWLRSLSANAPPPESFEPFSLQEQLQDLSARTPVLLPPFLEDALRWGAVLLVLAVLAAIFAWAVRRLRSDDETEIEEIRELIWSRQMFADQLATLLARLRAGRGVPSQDTSPYLSLSHEEIDRRRIRAAYQALLVVATTRDLARVPGQTPSEYAHRLSSHFPGSTDELSALTASYLAARYDPQTVSADQVATAEAASTALQADLRLVD